MKKLYIVAALCVCMVASAADTVVLRDGTRYTGQFISGSATTITFQEDRGMRRHFDLRDVQTIQFDRSNTGPVSSSGVLGSPTTQTSRNASAVSADARTIPAGTDLIIRTNEAIESTSGSEGRTYSGTVDRDIVDNTGRVVVPKGSNAELAVREVNTGGTTGSSELALDVQGLEVNGNRYLVSTEDVEKSSERGLGANRRTATMVGGGAALGTLLGAIAGGGKGAAIGAAAGAAAGAGVQVLTRGKEVKVPAETVLTFKLDQPVQLQPANR